MALGGRGEPGEKSYPTLRERSVRNDKMTKKLLHHHSQENAFSGSTKLFSEVRQAGFSFL